MKNNYNPYTVPENFFEENCRREIIRYRHRRRAILYSSVVVVAAALIFAAPAFVSLLTGEKPVTEDVMATNNLAQMYEYDIFLQVNF